MFRGNEKRKTVRRGEENRRIEPQGAYSGPERRKGERRSGIDRRSRENKPTMRGLVQSFANFRFTVYDRVLDIKDRLSGSTGDLTPPRHLQKHVGGAGNFKGIGEMFFSYFGDICHLQPHESILDIGCGTGRMAIPLLNYLNTQGRYIGFDISKKAIRWCRKHIATKNKNFSFFLADIYNGYYNPKGKLASVDYRFPCEDEGINFVFATSVFTHMFPDDVSHYLRELHRVLKPDGRAFLTHFILDETALALMERPSSRFNFKVNIGRCRSIGVDKPEAAIAFPESQIRKMYEEADLAIKEPILFGSWSGRESMLTFQDTVIVSKERG